MIQWKIEIISRSISMKVWDLAWFELVPAGSAVRHSSVARQVTDCATWPGLWQFIALHYITAKKKNRKKSFMISILD